MINIAIYGPPLSGKSAIAVALAKQNEVALTHFQIPYDGLTQTGAMMTLQSGEDQFLLYTLNGGIIGLPIWHTPLSDASGVVLVLDAQSYRSDQNLEFINYLCENFPTTKPGCIIYTKQDRADNNDLICPREKNALSQTPSDDWPVFYSRIDQPRSQTEPVEWLIGKMRGG